MSQFDRQYNTIINDIINNGASDEEFNVRTKWDTDGTPAHTLSVISKKMRFDNSEVPILTTKKSLGKQLSRNYFGYGSLNQMMLTN